MTAGLSNVNHLALSATATLWRLQPATVAPYNGTLKHQPLPSTVGLTRAAAPLVTTIVPLTRGIHCYVAERGLCLAAKPGAISIK